MLKNKLTKNSEYLSKCSVLMVLCLIILSAFVSCKPKDKDKTLKATFVGTLDFELKKYATVNTTLKLIPKGISHPDSKGFGYEWIVSWDNETKHITKKEEDPESNTGEFNITLPNKVGEYTISCKAYASDLIPGYKVKKITLVDPQKSLNLGETIENDATLQVFNDSRDGMKYRYIEIDGIQWMIENLKYKGDESSPKGLAYENENILAKIFGRYYNWEEAKQVCPSGWRLPKESDWLKMVNAVQNEQTFEPWKTFKNIAGGFMADAYFNKNTRMWEFNPKVTKSNKFKLSIIPCGYARKINDQMHEFEYFHSYASFWTDDEVGAGSVNAYYRYFSKNSNDIFIQETGKTTFYTSVRCIK